MIGGIIGFGQYAAEHPEMYTTDGVLSLVAQLMITMYSNPVVWGAFDNLEPALNPELEPNPDSEPDTGYQVMFDNLEKSIYNQPIINLSNLMPTIRLKRDKEARCARNFGGILVE